MKAKEALKKHWWAFALGAAAIVIGGVTAIQTAAADTYKVKYVDLKSNDMLDVTVNGKAVETTDAGGRVSALPDGITKAFAVSDDKVTGMTGVAVGTQLKGPSTIYCIKDADFEAMKTAKTAGETNDGAMWVNIGDAIYFFGAGNANDAGLTTVNIGDTARCVRSLNTLGVTTDGTTESFKIDPAGITVGYGDGGETWGVKGSAVGDEKTLDAGQFYPADAYVPVTGSPIQIANNDTMTTTVTINKDTVTYPGPATGSSLRSMLIVSPASYKVPGQTITGGSSVPWHDLGTAAVDFPSIKSIYLGSDLALGGNISFLFNGNTQSNFKYTFTLKNQDGTVLASYDGKVNESAYTNLTDVYFFSDTSNVEYASGLFARCPNLEHVYTDKDKKINLNKCNITSYMFFGDNKLVNGEGSFIDNIDLSGGVVKDTSYMFAACEKVVQPNVSDYKMDAVTDTEGMFLGAKNAGLIFGDGTEVYDISKWQMPSLVDAMVMFDGRTVDAKDLVTSNGINFTGYNPDYGPLKDEDFGQVVTGPVDLSKWGVMDSLVAAQFMFAQNDKIESATFGSSYKALVDMSEMFLRCDNLAKVDVVEGTKSIDAPNLEYAQYTFMGDGGEKGDSVKLPLNSPKLKNIAFMFYHSNFTDLDFAAEGDDTAVSFTAIEDAPAAFAEMPGLASIQLNEKDTFPALVRGQFMFFNDPGLANLPTGQFDLSALEDGSFMFMNDIALTPATTTWKIGRAEDGTDIPNMLYNTGSLALDFSAAGSHLHDASLAFAHNNALTKVTLPDLSEATNTFGTFANNQTLAEIDGTVTPTAASDLRGMFCGDSALTTVPSNIGALISNSAKDASYIFKDCPLLAKVDMASADTSNAEYLMGLFDGDKALTEVTGGANFTAARAKSIGTMFRNCNLSDAYAQNIVKNLGATTVGVTDMYGMFEGNQNIASLDFSPMDFTNASDLSNFTAGCNKLGVISGSAASVASGSAAKITLPANFAVSVTSGSKIFYVDPDENGDPRTTYLDIKSTVVPTFLEGYSWNDDNRKFAVLSDQTVNGKSGNSYEFVGDDDAVLGIEATPTLYLNGAPSPLTYSWGVSSGGAITAIPNETKDTYTAKKTVYGDGEPHYIYASATPSALAGTASADALFTLGAKISGIKATYTGGSVPIGEKYDKDKVKVVGVLPNGKTVDIPSSLWTADGDTVTKAGDNPFTATYKDGDKTYTATFTVPGKRVIGSIEAKYVGPAVAVGDSYDESNVEVTAYYSDDKNKSEGFAVKPTSFSGKKVSAVGSNTFTATYADPDTGKSFSAQFTVPGYREIGSIDAKYVGPAITVGNDYKKSDVIVTAYYADGSGSNVLQENDWTPDSLTVTSEGDNSFTATYVDPYGHSFTGGYTVKGVAAAEDKPAETATPTETKPDENGEYADLTGTYQGYDDDDDDGGSGTPDSTSGASGGVPTSTGNVQTGGENRMPFYIALILIFAGILAVAIGIKIRMKNDEYK